MIKVHTGQTLYKAGDDSKYCMFIVLNGKFLLHHDKVGAIGIVNTGDSLGEEGIFEKRDNGLPVIRKEIATAELDSYVIEISISAYHKLREILNIHKLSMDWFTFNNTLKRSYVQKKSWRQYKHNNTILKDYI